MKKAIPVGYYVDFTELAREFGWERISSYDGGDLSWKENIAGMEFWHYQKTDGLAWYPALRELYSDPALSAAFDWNALIRRREDPYQLRLKNIPQTTSAWRWIVLFP
jgi:TolB protein